jgi:hypothetical protein
MRWTLWHQLTSDAEADGEIVRSRSPDAGIKLLAGRFRGGDGGSKARHTEEITYKP